MRKYVLTGGSFALLALVLGAFATHALKAHFSAEVLQSFQTGIRYMMYHGLALIIFSKISLYFRAISRDRVKKSRADAKI